MNICIKCEHKKHAPEGICSKKNASDDLFIRCVGGWSKVKHYYLKRYIDTFTTSMRDKWEGNLYYIDLFAGPGKCRVRDNGEEIEGSPLIALNSKYPFTKYYFIDLNKKALDSLQTRCKSHQHFKRAEIIPKDCNIAVDDIINEIP